MVSLIYDGSWAGLLTSIFEVYERKLQEASIMREHIGQPFLFGDRISVVTDIRKSERVFNGLRSRLSPRGMLEFYSCYLSALPQMEEWLLDYAKLIFVRRDAEEAFGNNSVLRVSQTAKMVLRESHRMKGFVRFALTRDGFYYSAIEPDFNVLPLISRHFKERFADQKWLIYDVKRQYGLYYDLDDTSEVTLHFSKKQGSQLDSKIFTADESAWQALWREYFRSTDIASRKNMKLHLQHVPRRYWKYLPEKWDGEGLPDIN